MILRRIFENTPIGTYVDVGAYHPWRFSNTYFFYKRGWSGINLDATPGSAELFHKARPRDLSIEAAISRDGRELTLYSFDDPALNTLDEQVARKLEANLYRVVATRRVRTHRLVDILQANLSSGARIDFLTVDVEGMDSEVLESNDWSRFRPDYVLVERLGRSLEDLMRADVTKLLTGCGYDIFAKTVNTVFFRRRDQSEV